MSKTKAQSQEIVIEKRALLDSLQVIQPVSSSYTHASSPYIYDKTQIMEPLASLGLNSRGCSSSRGCEIVEHCNLGSFSGLPCKTLQQNSHSLIILVAFHLLVLRVLSSSLSLHAMYCVSSQNSQSLYSCCFICNNMYACIYESFLVVYIK